MKTQLKLQSGDFLPGTWFECETQEQVTAIGLADVINQDLNDRNKTGTITKQNILLCNFINLWLKDEVKTGKIKVLGVT